MIVWFKISLTISKYNTNLRNTNLSGEELTVLVCLFNSLSASGVEMFQRI